MGDVIPFNKKVRRSLDIEMMYDTTGFGVHPQLLKSVSISKEGTLYFIFSNPVELGLDPFMPGCAIKLENVEAAKRAAEELKEILKEYYGKDIKVYDDKNRS